MMKKNRRELAVVVIFLCILLLSLLLFAMMSQRDSKLMIKDEQGIPDAIEFEEIEDELKADDYESALALIDERLGQIGNESLYSQQGWIYFHLENYELATDSFRNALVHMPYNADAYNGKGWSLFRLGSYDESLKHFSRVMDMEQEQVSVQESICASLGAGWISYLKGNYIEAIEYFNKVIAYDAAQAYAFSGKGWCLDQLGRHEEADVNFETARQTGADENKDAASVSGSASVEMDIDSFLRAFESKIYASSVSVPEEVMPVSDTQMLTFGIDKPYYKIDRTTFSLDIPVYINSDYRSMISLKHVANAFGLKDGQTKWYDEKMRATIIMDDRVIHFGMGKYYYTIDGEKRRMDTVAEVKDGIAVLPIRYVASALGISDDRIRWKQQLQTLEIEMEKTKK